MVNISKENLCINKVIANKKEVLTIEGDMIVPDTKPDILKTISTSGIASTYKVELLEGKIRIDGGIDTYIMYMPDGGEDSIRGLNTTLDFSEILDVENIKSDMQAFINTSVKSIDTRVINGRKISIKVTLEICIKVFAKEETEIVNDVTDENDVQMLKREINLNSLVGSGTTRINGKDTIQIDETDQFAEILKVKTNITAKDIKISYNKVLTKAEAEIKIMYLTEDNRIREINPKIPIVGFIDIPEVTENDQYDINYELKNSIIKPQIQEQQSIYIDLEYEVTCNVYKEKNINLIEDLYKPDMIYKISRKNISTISDKMCINKTKMLQEKVNLMETGGKSLIDVDVEIQIQKETKINSKILYELEANLTFMFLSQNMELSTQSANIPFEYVIDNLNQGESLNTTNDIEVLSQDFILQENGNINCNINLNISTNIYKNKKIELISEIEEEKPREEEEYSLMIYIVKKDDSLWKIAKEFGSTIDDIAKLNEIENPNEILVGQKIFIPKYVKVPVNNNG